MMNTITGILLLLLISYAQSHSFLSYPDAYNRKFQLRNCKGTECSQACPSILEDSKMRNTEENPAAVWERGQTVVIKWARNNHEHGFVRFAIVPVRNMMSRKWHKKLAIFYGCFSQGKIPCSPEECGSDRGNVGYSAEIKIPSVFPDGLYAFAVVWYGGVRLKTGIHFSDYWSCSFVRIEGGVTVGGSYSPFFDVGDNEDAKMNGNKCLTAIDAPGVCPNNGCTGTQAHKVPKPFKGGRKPDDLTKTIVDEAF